MTCAALDNHPTGARFGLPSVLVWPHAVPTWGNGGDGTVPAELPVGLTQPLTVT